MVVSVIIPLYNVEQYISNCLDSVLSQDFKDVEFIIIDDRGSDHSLEIAKQYQKKDSRIKIISHDENKGSMHARKTGYLNAKGDYFFFLDSDDTLPPNCMSLLVSEMTKSHADILIGRMLYTNGLGEYKLPQKVKGIFNSTEIFTALLKDEINHSLCGRLFSKKSFADSDTFICYEKQTNSEDMILFHQLVDRATRICVADIDSYIYRYNSQSSSHIKFNENQFIQIIRALNFRYNFLKGKVEDRLLLGKMSQKIVEFIQQGLPYRFVNNIDYGIIEDIKRSKIKSSSNKTVFLKCALKGRIMWAVAKNLMKVYQLLNIKSNETA